MVPASLCSSFMTGLLSAGGEQIMEGGPAWTLKSWLDISPKTLASCEIHFTEKISHSENNGIGTIGILKSMKPSLSIFLLSADPSVTTAMTSGRVCASAAPLQPCALGRGPASASRSSTSSRIRAGPVRDGVHSWFWSPIYVYWTV